MDEIPSTIPILIPRCTRLLRSLRRKAWHTGRFSDQAHIPAKQNMVMRARDLGLGLRAKPAAQGLPASTISFKYKKSSMPCICCGTR
jgi:hypothetical protein